MTIPARLAIDIGGTFTDLALERNGERISAKVLTTSAAPEEGVMTGLGTILARANVRAADLTMIIHGTTLATNAIIERKGAKTALLVTDGFRDAIEIAYENRFEQYDIFMEKPPPLVPRQLRLPVSERIDARGNVFKPLDETGLAALVPTLRAHGVTSVAVGFMHAYAYPQHERRARDVLKKLAPDLYVTLSSDVSPEIREYERWSTAVANAYVQPVMAGYLGRLQSLLGAAGVTCPVFLMTSAGGLTTIEIARSLPVRLVESGPAGGAILASRIAEQCGFDRVLSFDMGGTTAKICMIDDGTPQYSRTFEVARQYRFLKGSGLPLRIPVVEMVEIGAGGGSIATVDAMRRIQVGPESAGSEPGPACYSRGGTEPTVTDADLLLGAIDPSRFAGGSIKLEPERSARAMQSVLGERLGFTPEQAAYGITEVVEENMANAARVHAVERGKELAGRTMIAFGGAAPLHAANLAQKLDIARIVVPSGAGVGSAVGFLLAPVAYEVVRTRYMGLDAFDPAAVDAMRREMRAEAESVVRLGAPTGVLADTWTADMRYRGQGHDITVTIPAGEIEPLDLAERFEREYEQTFGMRIPGMVVEIMSWALRLAAPAPSVPPLPSAPAAYTPKPATQRDVFDAESGSFAAVPLYWRFDLRPGAVVHGPAIIAEDETSTLVTGRYNALINSAGYIVLERK